MTLEQFRSNPDLVANMRSLIGATGDAPTVLAQAIVAVQNERLILDARDNDDEIVSVRLLSRVAERQEVISDLLSCAEPWPVQQEESPPTFGVDPSQFVEPLKP